ncbi:MAG: DNA polymerase III, subunit gamma and tau [Eggerthella sp. 51_9]|nr:MAG: DNA polymerase III, subunit gamma and tau [Eggerthella sp. 51_9]
MEALYRKYRPSTFADVVGQEHIERTLKNAIEQDKVSHAYLFCGPRGTGKTTTARILAKALMCEKGPTIEPDGTCEECQAIAQGTHPDVYELDAASRTGVENVREEIISRVSYAPTRGAWKVYIIDEVHMLSTAAFNALLKTIEEPPSHVVFILCTTDPQKVPETILSRCQRFDFHRISIESIVARLGAVCAEEGVEFEAEALDLIAHRAEGGMRNALTSLEQLIAYCGGKATLEGAQSLLGSLDNADLSEIVEAIGRRDAAACFNWVAQYVETGADLAQFVHDLAEHVRTLYLMSMAGLDVELQISESMRTVMIGELKLFGQDRLSRMLVLLGDVSKELRVSSNPRLTFEIALTRMVRPESDLTLEALAERVEELERRLSMLGNASSPAEVAPSASVRVGGGAPQYAAVPAQSTSHAPSAPVAASAGSSGQPAPSAQVPAALVAQDASGRNAAWPQGSVSAPVAPSAPQTPPAVASSVPQASAPTPAVQPAGSFSQAPETVQPRQAAALTAQVDLSNPAAVQRLWHSVTASLRKVNPARGVLFMNAKVSAEADGQGIVVEFGKDSAFAFNAAQKAEVQELLAKTIQTVAGGTVPYRLALAGNSSSVAPVAAQPASAQSGMASQSNAVPPAAKNPYAAKAVAAVRAAQAAAKANQAPVTQTAAKVNQAQGFQSAPQNATSYAAPSAPQQMGGGVASSSSPRSQASSMPRRSAAVQQAPAATPSVSAVPEPYDDQVPLDVYGASVSAEYDEDPYAQQYGSSPSQQSSVSASSAQPSSGSGPASAGSAQGGAPVAAASTQAGGVPNVAAPASAQAAAPSAYGQDEAEQIKSILTQSFGEGIKFEELPE